MWFPCVLCRAWWLLDDSLFPSVWLTVFRFWFLRCECKRCVLYYFKRVDQLLLCGPAGNGLHPGGAPAAGHPRPAAALLPLAGRASAARDEELRNARQPAGQVRELAALPHVVFIKWLLWQQWGCSFLVFQRLSSLLSGTSCWWLCRTATRSSSTACWPLTSRSSCPLCTRPLWAWPVSSMGWLSGGHGRSSTLCSPPLDWLSFIVSIADSSRFLCCSSLTNSLMQEAKPAFSL